MLVRISRLVGREILKLSECVIWLTCADIAEVSDNDVLCCGDWVSHAGSQQSEPVQLQHFASLHLGRRTSGALMA